jgi:hypothetical protein
MLLDVSSVGVPAYRATAYGLPATSLICGRLAVRAKQFDRAPPLGARRPPEVGANRPVPARSTNSRRGVARVSGDIRIASIVFIEDRKDPKFDRHGPQSGPAAGTAR